MPFEVLALPKSAMRSCVVSVSSIAGLVYDVLECVDVQEDSPPSQPEASGLVLFFPRASPP